MSQFSQIPCRAKIYFQDLCFRCFATLGVMLILPMALSAKQDTIRLNLSAYSEQYPLNEQDYWVETYNNQINQLDFGLFSFSHIINGFGGMDVGDDMSYWDGFTLSASTDNTDYGKQGSSADWVSHQWGCIAGAPVAADGTEGAKGAPFLVAYWDLQGTNSCQVFFTDGNAYRPLGMYLCNHPWPYYGNIHGDGFAREMNQEGDYFRLLVHGVGEDGVDTGEPVVVSLAEFKDGTLYQSDKWEWIDLRALGKVASIYFTMETTDMSLYGGNTAFYFCMDHLTVVSDADNPAPNRPQYLEAVEDEYAEDDTDPYARVTFSWQSDDEVDYYEVLLNGKVLTTTTQQSIYIDTLRQACFYRFSVEAVNKQGIHSDRATTTLYEIDEQTGEATEVATRDRLAPSVPTNLRVVEIQTNGYVRVAWDASTDNSGACRYTLYINGMKEITTANTTARLYCGSDADYLIEVDAYDTAGNRSARIGVHTAQSPTTSIGAGIVAEDSSDDATYYTLTGMVIGNTQPTQQGVYLLQQNAATRKIIVR